MKVVKVLQGPAARYLPATGMLLVSRSAESIFGMLTKGSPDPDECDEITTFVHECVHHLQVLSSAYLQLDAIARVKASIDVVLPRRPEERQRAAEEITRREYAFRYRAFGVSCADLCEASAVLESYKAMAAEPRVEEFLDWRDSMFPGKGNYVYRRTFDVMADKCGKQTAFDLLSVVTYLCLQGDIPGQSFELLINNPRIKDKGLADASAHDIIEALGFAIPAMARLENVSRLAQGHQHPTLYPVLRETAKALAGEAVEVYARPHRALRSPLQNSVLPPLVIGAHQQGGPTHRAFGAARESKELRLKLHIYTAMVATAERLVTGRQSFVPCPLTECPNHASGACSGWYVPPKEADLCGFRAEIQGSSGKELHQIVEDCEHLFESETIRQLRSSNDLSVIFPGAKLLISRDDESEMTSAEEFDVRQDLDPLDNDGLNMFTCTKCRAFWQEWASHRKMTRGYVAVCPNCGTEQETGTDRATIIPIE